MKPVQPIASTARLLRVGALAVASPRANAVGTVRLTCTAEGLAVDLLQVGRFAAGFAMLGMARPVSFRVPYTAVRGLVRAGAALHLSIDPLAAAPYNRFALCRFSADPHAVLMQAFRARAGARLLSLLFPLPLAGLVAWLVPRALVGGPVGLVALALVAAWGSWQLLTQLVSWLTWGGPASDRLRQRFEQTVAEHLGLEPAEAAPATTALAPAAASASADPVRRAQVHGAWAAATRPRAFALVCGFALVAALGAILAVKRYGVADVVVLPVEAAHRGMAAPLRRSFASVVAAGMPHHPSCSCRRTVSPLWQAGIPLLSVMISPRKGELDRMWFAPGETVPVAHASERDVEIEFDLAVVNNSAAELDTVSLIVTFAQRTESGRRTAIQERGLHWPAKLRPGRAVKWRIEAEGTEFRIDSRLTDKLGTVPAASADAFHELRNARLMPVRVHGAMMLAYLGDSRARAAAEAVGPLTAVEERARAQILRTLEPLRTCDWQASGGQLALCVHNGTGELLRAVRLAEQAPETAQGRRWWVEDYFHPGRGLRLSLPLEDAAPPERLSVAPAELRGGRK